MVLEAMKLGKAHLVERKNDGKGTDNDGNSGRNSHQSDWNDGSCGVTRFNSVQNAKEKRGSDKQQNHAKMIPWEDVASNIDSKKRSCNRNEEGDGA